jgi:hypothetical protein
MDSLRRATLGRLELDDDEATEDVAEDDASAGVLIRDLTRVTLIQTCTPIDQWRRITRDTIAP